MAGPNFPVARVNGVTLYQSDLSCAVEASLARKLGSRQGDLLKPDRREGNNESNDTLDRLINIELLYQESLKHRFHGLIEQSEERYRAEVRRIGGEDKLAAALQCNDMVPEQFRKSIFRNLSIKRLLNKVVYSGIKVRDDEIRGYYENHRQEFRKPESVRVSHILIRAPSGTGNDKWKEVENRALMIYRDAARGVDFVRLARRHSDDPASASAGGDIGFIEKGSKKGFLDTTIFQLSVGSVSKPVRSHQGFHIIKITSVTPPLDKTLEEARNEIIMKIRRKRSRELTARLITELRSKAEIEIIKNR